MKINKLLLTFFMVGALCSCENKEVVFPDFDYTSVYFANQYPMRTLELGDDPQVDNSLDQVNKVKITATMGGVYSNNQDRIIKIKVDESLCEGIVFDESGTKILPLPANYYNLVSVQIVIEAGSILGGVIVEFTDAFFEDPLTVERNYVIPVVMTDVVNADTILSGKPSVDVPNRLVGSDWVVAPKDFVLYGIKYVNPYHAIYLRRGVDEISKGANSVSDLRHKDYVENDEVVALTTTSRNGCVLPVTIYEDDDLTTRAEIELILSFDEKNNCVVSSNSSSYTISGSGKFVTDGEKNSLGGLDRDGLYLDYSVELIDLGYTYHTKDTLVCRNRGITAEYYSIKFE